MLFFLLRGDVDDKYLKNRDGAVVIMRARIPSMGPGLDFGPVTYEG